MLAILAENIKDLAVGADERVLARSPGWGREIEARHPWQDGRWHGAGYRARVSAVDCGAASVLMTAACSSALDVAWRLVFEGQFELMDSVLAVEQWAGRGQMGRTWISPPGNLYVAWYLPAHFRLLPAISVRVGVAGVLLLREMGLPAELKWPNDLMARGKKVGGILCEERGERLMVGVGINIESAPSDRDLRSERSPPATSLRQEGLAVRPLALWLRMRDAWAELLEKGATSVALWNNCLAYRGQKVEVRRPNGSYCSALVEGVEPDGALRVRTPTGPARVVSGSILLAADV